MACIDGSASYSSATGRNSRGLYLRAGKSSARAVQRPVPTHRRLCRQDPAPQRASGHRVEFFIAEVAGNYGDRDGKVAGVLGETGNQRSRSFLAGGGGEYQGGDIFVALNKVEDLLRFVAFTDHALRHHARDA